MSEEPERRMGLTYEQVERICAPYTRFYNRFADRLDSWVTRFEVWINKKRQQS